MDDDAVAFNDMPWHRFGTKLASVSTAEEAVRAARLDWRVVLSEVGSGTPGHRLLVRQDIRDKQTDGKLAEVRADYRPIQNVDAFGFFDPIVKSGDAVYDCIGVTDGGKWIWITARMRQVNEIAVRDPIAGFILLAYKHGTTGPPGAASSGKAPTIGCKPVRIICKTVLNDGLLYPLLRVRVTQSGTTTLEGSPTAATKKIAIHFHSLADIFRAMLGIEMGENRLRSYLEAVFPKARASGRGNKYRDPTDRDRAIKQCIRLFVEGKGNDLPGARSTLWAAYSAVSEYVDYYETRFDDPARLHGIWGCPLKSYAMAKATELVRAL